MDESPWKFESSRPHQKLFVFKVVKRALAQFGTNAFGRLCQKHDKITDQIVLRGRPRRRFTSGKLWSRTQLSTMAGCQRGLPRPATRGGNLCGH